MINRDSVFAFIIKNKKKTLLIGKFHDCHIDLLNRYGYINTIEKDGYLIVNECLYDSRSFGHIKNDIAYIDQSTTNCSISMVKEALIESKRFKKIYIINNEIERVFYK